MEIRFLSQVRVIDSHWQKFSAYASRREKSRIPIDSFIKRAKIQMENYYEEFVKNSIDQVKLELKDISQFLWSNPETANQEFKAHDKLTLYLEQKGFKIQRKTPLNTAFVATYAANNLTEPLSHNPVHGALLCEYDALPKIGHACGHNLIAIIALGAAIAIKEVLEHHLIPGQVTVIGSPAEETGGGKIDHIKYGSFEGIDFALMAHPGAVNKAAPRKLVRQQMTASFLGKAAHASNNSSQGCNALDAAVLAYQNIACLRQQFIPGWQVQTIISKGGDAVNIIPDNTELSIMIRAINKDGLNKLRERVIQCLQGAAISTSTTIKQNNPTIQTNELSAVNRPSGSTDMGNVSQVVPSLHPVFQICEFSAHTKEFLECSSSDDAFQKSINQAEILALISLRLMTDKSILASVWEEFLHKKL